MSKVDELKSEIERLPKDEFTELVRWLSEKDWERWDKEIEADSEAGKLDFLVREAVDAKAKGTLKDLWNIAQQPVSGLASRVSHKLFSEWLDETSTFWKKTLHILRYTSKRSASFGLWELGLITERWQSRMERISSGFGSVPMMSMNDSSNNRANYSLESAAPRRE
jgi:hypothetical protein